MAFDHSDTDRLFDNAILPVLKANGVVPVIINRREDNRDINQQIIEQLEVCDFCITDLTYARPSVYFETGYAQRAVEVIYTVRSDHLNKNQPDDLRVHFDLQMKPLIRWTTPEDKGFPDRLDRRIKSTFLRKWNRLQKGKEAEKRQQDEFAHMPLAERLTKLWRGAVGAISQLGFCEWIDTSYISADTIGYRQILSRVGAFRWVMAQRRDRRLLHVVSIRVEDLVSLKKLRDEFQRRFVSSSYPPHLDGGKMVEERSPVNRTVEHHILCSIRPVPHSRIMSALPSLSWDSANSRYSTAIDWSYRGHRMGKRKEWVNVELTVLRVLYVYFIDGIRSLPEFQNRIGRISEQIISNPKRPARRRR